MGPKQLSIHNEIAQALPLAARAMSGRDELRRYLHFLSVLSAINIGIPPVIVAQNPNRIAIAQTLSLFSPYMFMTLWAIDDRLQEPMFWYANIAHLGISPNMDCVNLQFIPSDTDPLNFFEDRLMYIEEQVRYTSEQGEIVQRHVLGDEVRTSTYRDLGFTLTLAGLAARPKEYHLWYSDSTTFLTEQKRGE